jgi:hypothetical protein
VEPEVLLAENFGLSAKQISELTKLVEKHKDEIKNAWKEHFAG